MIVIFDERTRRYRLDDDQQTVLKEEGIFNGNLRCCEVEGDKRYTLYETDRVGEYEATEVEFLPGEEVITFSLKDGVSGAHDQVEPVDLTCELNGEENKEPPFVRVNGKKYRVVRCHFALGSVWLTCKAEKTSVQVI